LPTASWTSFAAAEHGTWVVAHRGASAQHRENSPEAFEAAFADGANAVETDVRRTADGVFVCHHDETLRRTAGVDVAVSSVTFDELRRLAPNDAVRLTDVLGRAQGRCNVLLDLKLRGDGDIGSLLDLLKSIKADDSIATGVRSLGAQAQIRQLHPDLVQLALLESPDQAPQFVVSGGRWVRLWERDASSARIEAIHALGVPALVMVGGPGTDRIVGDIAAEGARSLIDRGADGLMLNDPRVATRATRLA
jgi:glycerophosphoryl diester phosphodiesterase